MLLTAVDESPDEAVKLSLPLENGESMPFEDVTAEQVERAYRLIPSYSRGGSLVGCAEQD